MKATAKTVIIAQSSYPAAKLLIAACRSGWTSKTLSNLVMINISNNSGGMLQRLRWPPASWIRLLKRIKVPNMAEPT